MGQIPLIVIGGPTASGKTGLSIALAKRLGGEIISADSMQVYRYMDIGTAKPTVQEREGIVHHLMDFLLPTQDFSVAEYAPMAHAVIAQVWNRGKVPILVGGTGLYIDTVVENRSFAKGETDPQLRRELEEFADTYGNGALHQKLKEIDPKSAANIHENNRKRVIRAIEIYQTTGLTMWEQNQRSKSESSPYCVWKVGINWDRETLRSRINLRVDQMMQQGLVEEVRRCVAMGATKEHTSMQGIGYKELLDYLEGVSSLEEAVETVKLRSRQYAKRQMTWFRRSQMDWLDPGGDVVAQALEKLEESFNKRKGECL